MLRGFLSGLQPVFLDNRGEAGSPNAWIKTEHGSGLGIAVDDTFEISEQVENLIFSADAACLCQGHNTTAGGR
jgi:hypothetical protein